MLTSIRTVWKWEVIEKHSAICLKFKVTIEKLYYIYRFNEKKVNGEI